MRWIKASEKIPDNSHGVHWRNANDKNPINSALAVRIMANNKKHEVEWLDESESPSHQSEQQIKEWIEVEAGLICRNFDEHTGFRKCANLLLPEVQRLKEENYLFSGIISGMDEEKKEWVSTCIKRQSIIDQLNQTIEEQKREIGELKKELDGWARYKQNIDEALNSGDGVYRP